MKLLDIVVKLESAFPLSDAAEWDCVGWQIKSKNENIEIKNLLIAIDITESVIDEAIKENVKLIIVHHPFIFTKDFSDMINNKWKKILYEKLIKNSINVYVLHTNFDKSSNGMSFLIAQDLKLDNIEYFDSEKFSVSGSFNNLSLKKVIKLVKKYFGFKQIKVIATDLTTKINKVVLAPGAGGSIIELLNKTTGNKNDISLLITGEMKWHQELEALDKNITVLVVGHNMEEKFVEFISKFLLKEVFSLESISIKKYFFHSANFI